MASQTPFTNGKERAMQQLEAESLFLLSAHSEETATHLPDRSDFWAVVMGGRPTLPGPLSLPDSSPKRPQVEEEEEALNESVPKRPRRNPPRPTKTQGKESCPSLPGSRPKRPAEDEAPDEHRPKRPRVYPPVGACPYSKPLLPTRELVIEAILSAPDKQMSVKDIKQYLQSHYPWYTWGSACNNVSTSIRNALGRGQAPKRLEEVPDQQGYWRVKAEYLTYLSHLGSIAEG